MIYSSFNKHIIKTRIIKKGEKNKKQKNVLIVFAILAILCLGIGYAGLTDVLTLNGTINIEELTFENEKEFNVVWVSGTATPTPSSDSHANRSTLTANAVASSDNDLATLTVNNDLFEIVFTGTHTTVDLAANQEEVSEL